MEKDKLNSDEIQVFIGLLIMMIIVLGFAYYSYNNPRFDYSVCENLINASSSLIEKCK